MFFRRFSTCSPFDNKSYTKQYQKHSPSGFCIKLVCDDGINYEQEPIIYTKTSKDDDVVELFVETIEKEIKKFYNTFKFPKMMKFCEKEKKLFKEATHCHICDGKF